MTSHFRPLLGPREGKGETATSDFAPLCWGSPRMQFCLRLSFLFFFLLPCFVAWPLQLGLGTLNPRFVAWPLQLGLGTLNPRFVAWPLELGLGTLNPRFVAWPLQLGLGTLNPRFVVWPLELGLVTLNPRFVAWPLELGLGTLHTLCRPCQENYPVDAHTSMEMHTPVVELANPAWPWSVHPDARGQQHGIARLGPRSSQTGQVIWGLVDTAKTCSDPQKVSMCKGNRRRQRQPNQQHGLMPPPDPDFIVGKNENYKREHCFGLFLLHKFWVPHPLPLLDPDFLVGKNVC